MQSLQLQRQAVRGNLKVRSSRKTPRVVCQAVQENDKLKQVAVASVVASALLFSSAVHPEAAAAARSGGRVSSSGFAARRAAPAPSARRSSTTTVNHYNTTIVAAPPVMGGFGYGMPFFGGGFGFGFRPGFVMPFPFMGSILQFTFLMLIVSVVFNVVKAAIGGKKKRSDDDWDQL